MGLAWVGYEGGMPRLISGVRGTVQGVVAASMYAVWYLDWRTGGGTVLETGSRRTS